MRVTHADRDVVVGLLKDAYSEGRLEHEEFDERVSRALRARTQSDLEPLLTDLETAEGEVSVRPATAAPAATRPAGEERAWAAAAHLLGYPLLPLGPLLVLLARGDTSPFVRRHAVEALNMQLTFLIATLTLPIIVVVTIGLGALAYVLLALSWVLLPLLGAGLAALGAPMSYPLRLRFVKQDAGRPAVTPARPGRR
ncbi:MAG: DUF1707 domain-containing protein [Streptosporangiales bacterium]|nr:DUF1707 domain-containing protein [Streptosporangiales bacterium]